MCIKNAVDECTYLCVCVGGERGAAVHGGGARGGAGEGAAEAGAEGGQRAPAPAAARPRPALALARLVLLAQHRAGAAGRAVARGTP